MIRSARSLAAALLAAALTLIALVAFSGFALAQPAAEAAKPPREIIEQWDATAAAAQERIESGTVELDEIDALRTALQEDRAEITDLAGRLDAQLAPFRTQLDALGPAPEGGGELLDVTKQRARLATTVEELTGLRLRVDQADARAVALMDRLVALRRAIFTERLLSRGPSIVDGAVARSTFASLGSVASKVWAETAERANLSENPVGGALRLLTILALVAAALFSMFRVRRIVMKRLRTRVDASTPASRRIAIATGLVAVRLIGPAIVVAIILIGLLLSGYVGPQGRGVLTALAVTCGFVIGAHALSGAFFAPHVPALRISRLGDDDAIRAHRMLIALAAIFGLDRTIVVNGEQLGVSLEGLTLVNTLLITTGGALLWFLTRALLSRADEPEEPAAPDDDEAEDPVAEGEARDRGLVYYILRMAGIVLCAAAVIAPVLALTGYYAASRAAFYPPVLSAALIGGFVLLATVTREVVEHVLTPAGTDGPAPADGRGRGERRLRLLPVVVGFLLTIGALPLLAMIWGANPSDLVAAWRMMAEGFQVGEIVISPLEFVYFAVVFAVGYLVTRAIQGILRRSVLPLTTLDAGGRAAVNAGVGYLGITVAALIAVSTAGIDLSNLAIVAGALSVGIGFGLQTIVSNFVSGVILLIERPIKAGDWISLPSGMGYVKQINVRSTEIETFDHSSLFVPNSELISNTVTNYTHDNLHGRLIVKVRVPFGTDTRKVEEILLSVARGHPMALRRPAPWIYFAGFGESALDFEIRVILRDVNWVLNVRSDMNHEIVRRFAEEGITIPFPQQDLHLRTAPAALAPRADAASQDAIEEDEEDGTEDAVDGGEAAAAAGPERRTGARDRRPARDDPDAPEGADLGGDGGSR